MGIWAWDFGLKLSTNQRFGIEREEKEKSEAI